MINVWEHGNSRREAEHFCEVHSIDGPVLLDETGSYAARVGVRGVPFNLVVDARGVVRAAGVTTPDELAAVLGVLLTEQRPSD
jgi:hypothetical protein